MPHDSDDQYDDFDLDDPETDEDDFDVAVKKLNSFQLHKGYVAQNLNKTLSKSKETLVEKPAPPPKIILDLEKVAGFAPEEQDVLLNLFDLFIEDNDYKHPEAKATLLAYDVLITTDAFLARRKIPLA